MSPDREYARGRLFIPFLSGVIYRHGGGVAAAATVEFGIALCEI